ncbi:MAG: isochorismate synthase [Prevotella sp.]
MTGFACFRLPHANRYTVITQTEGLPAELNSCESLDGQQGFVFAPFTISEQSPLILIRPDRTETYEVTADTPQAEDDSLIPSFSVTARQEEPGIPDERRRYTIDFANFHAQLSSGTFRKIVLARTCHIGFKGTANARQLFLKACRAYPRMFIALVSTPQTGTWLMATPEKLIDQDGDTWQTVALAGTMELTAEQQDFDNPPGNADGNQLHWSDKNREEQHHVSTYITECLEHFTADFSKTGPYTARAGNLVHLRTDFHFSLPDNRHIGQIVATLHPTPAVCGLPMQEARAFILHNESEPRGYYSGFAGPLSLPIPGTAQQDETHLYVSLRCMQILPQEFVLHAGGGLMPGSREEQEWEETEAKMNTMKSLILP